MLINYNCPNCGRLLEDIDNSKDEITCNVCECVIDVNYDIIITEEGIETEIMLFKEKG